jgi:hypothetical protein
MAGLDPRSFPFVTPGEAGVQLFKIIVMAGLDPAISSEDSRVKPANDV